MLNLSKKKDKVTTFKIQAKFPDDIEIGSQHEDNGMFYGEIFEILTITSIEKNEDGNFPYDERYPYTIKGTCKLL